MTDQLVQRGVEFGCAVTAQTVPNGTVQVAAGGVIYDNAPRSIAAVPSLDILSGNPADATYPRLDYVVFDNTGAVSQVVGTADGVNRVPFYPGALAAVNVGAGVTTITSADIIDMRDTAGNDFVLRHLSPYRITDLWYGPIAGAIGTSNAWATGECYFAPFFSGKSLDVKAIGCDLSVAGTAGSKGRLGIYLDDGAGALSLLGDAGQVALDGATGALSLTIAETIPPGWAWLTLAFQSLGVTKPTMRTLDRMTTSPIGAFSIDNAAIGHVGSMSITGVTGALGASPTGFSYNVLASPGVWVQAA